MPSPRVPLVELPPAPTIALDVVAWAGLSFAVGYLTHRQPVDRYARDRAITRLRAFEAGGRWYERRLRIGAWKGRVPEAGGFYDGGYSKAAIADRSSANLERYAAETRRAELTHWLLMACGPLFAIWNPPVAVAAHLTYAVGANLPCIAIQRYNRARLQRVLDRRAARAQSLSIR